MNEDKLEVAIQDGIRARQLFESDAFKKSIKNVQDRLFKDWLLVKDREAREGIWHDYRATINLITELQQYVSNGKVAERELAEKSNG